MVLFKTPLVAGFKQGVAQTSPRLDVDNLYAVHSPHLIVTAFAGSPTIRIRRDEDDAEMDFTPDQYGWVRSRDVLEWLGDNQGTCVRLYDQSDNSRDAFNDENISQPFIRTDRAYIYLRFESLDDKRLPVLTCTDFARNQGAVSLMAVRRHFSPVPAATPKPIIHVSTTTQTNPRCAIGMTAAYLMQASGRRLDANTTKTSEGFAADYDNWAVEVGRFDYTNNNLHHHIDQEHQSLLSFQIAGSTSNTASAAVDIGRNGSVANNCFDGHLAATVFIQDLLSDNETDTIVSDFARMKFEPPLGEDIDTKFNPLTLTVGNAVTVYTRAQLQGKGLNFYLDGPCGTFAPGEYLGFNTPGIAMTTGTETAIATTVVDATSEVQGIPAAIDYCSGACGYTTSGGTKIVVYHSEEWPGGNGSKFYTRLGIAKWSGTEWEDCGYILAPEVPFTETPTGVRPEREMYGGTCVVKDGYFYVYFRDPWDALNGSVRAMCVGRTLLTDLETAIGADTVPVFNKYHQGAWTELGLGGTSTRLDFGNFFPRSIDVVLHAASGIFLAVLSDVYDMYLMQSRNGVHWGKRQKIPNDGARERLYVSFLGDHHRECGSTVQIYYSTSDTTGISSRWDNAELWRRPLTIAVA